MLAALVVLVLLAAVFVRLGAWQLDRAALRGAAAARETESARIAAAPVPLWEALRVGQGFTAEQQLRKVVATGRLEQQALVPDRVVDGAPAVLVVTALWLDAGPDAGAMIPVVRGWVASDDVVVTPTEVRVSPGVRDALEVPTDVVTVVGYLSDSEQAVTGALPDGTVGAISTAQLANIWGGPTFTGFVVLAESMPATSLATLPPPSYSQQSGMNLQNLAYAGEWVLFGGFALFLWWRMVREEAVRERETELLSAG